MKLTETMYGELLDLIKQKEKEKNKEKFKQIELELPLPFDIQMPPAEKKIDENEERGIVIIDL